VKRYPLFFPGILILALLLTGCFSRLALNDGPYQGKVADAATKEPIEGVVILAHWYKDIPTVAGAVSRYYDVQETVTDENGEFLIPGQGPRVMSNIEPPLLHIFKAGYEYLGGIRNPLDYDLYLKIGGKGGGSKAIIPLKKLTIAERKNRGTPPLPPDEAPLNKVIMMLREIDEERVSLGLDKLGIWGGEKYE